MIAGTAGDREASEKEAATAAGLAETELPKILEKIRKLQEQADRIERDARLAQKRCEEQGDTVSKLRELKPENIVGSVRADVQTIESTLGRELRDTETRTHELECCLSPDRYRNEATYLEMLERSFRAAVSRVQTDRMFTRKLSPEWPAIKAEIESEYAELQSRLAELKTAYDEAITAAELPLDYYAR